MARLEPNMDPTLIGCPDCSGVLSVGKEGAEGHLRYTCHVGHSFSLYSLLEAKETQLEQALWSVVSLLHHVGMLCDEVKNQTDSADLRRRVEDRMRQVTDHEHAVRTVIEQTDPPMLESGWDAACSR
jgi:two-component system chemotaxis response regulator CheB